MSDPDRGAYAPPTDAPLSFDARQPVRGSQPAPLMLIVSAIVLVLLVIAIVLFYRTGVREAGAPPQTVGAPVGELKETPPVEAQPADPAAGLQIYRSEDGASAPAAPTFVPPPEQPKLTPDPGFAAAPPPPAPRAAPSAPVAALPAQPVLKPSVSPPPPAKAAAPAPKAVTPPPAPKAATPAAKAPASVGGSAAVQIGAFSSQALADKGWNDAARIAPGLAAGKGKRVEQIQKDGSTLFRTQVTGFASRADAAAFCNQLKASGKNCFVK